MVKAGEPPHHRIRVLKRRRQRHTDAKMPRRGRDDRDDRRWLMHRALDRIPHGVVGGAAAVVVRSDLPIRKSLRHQARDLKLLGGQIIERGWIALAGGRSAGAKFGVSTIDERRGTEALE